MQANPRFLICYKSLMNDIGNGGTRVHSMYHISEKANFLRPMKHRFNFFSSQKGEGGSDGRQRRSGSRNCSDLSGSSCAKQRTETRVANHEVQSVTYAVRLTRSYNYAVISFFLSFTDSLFRLLCQKVGSVYAFFSITHPVSRKVVNRI